MTAGGGSGSASGAGAKNPTPGPGDRGGAPSDTERILRTCSSKPVWASWRADTFTVTRSGGRSGDGQSGRDGHQAPVRSRSTTRSSPSSRTAV